MGDDAAESLGTSPQDYLEQFKLLCKATSGRATAAIVEKVVRHRHIFVFGEILELDCVQRLRGTPEEFTMRLLEIFAYGSVADYMRQRETLPALPEPALRKLRQLTLISLASGSKTLSYEQLFEALQLSSVRELEDLVIASTYQGLVRGKLNHAERRLEVQGASARDVTPAELDSMIERLGSWCDRSESLLAALEAASAEAVASSAEAGASAEAVRRGVLDARQRLPAPNLASTMARQGGTSLTDKMMRGTRGGPRGGGLDPEMDYSYSAG
jgi:COP9 signalosome complex subunit 7